MTGKEAWHSIALQNFNFMDEYAYKKEIDIIVNEFELLEAILKDLQVDISAGKEVYTINATYDKKSKVYELLKKKFEED